MSSVSCLLPANSNGVVVDLITLLQLVLGYDDADWVGEAVEEAVRRTLETK